MWGCPEKFALQFQKDLETVDPRGAAAGSIRKGQKGRGRKARDMAGALASSDQTKTSLGLRTAVLAFATNWLMRHCRGKLDDAKAGEVTTML